MARIGGGGVRVEALTSDRFGEVVEILNEFTGGTGKACCCCLPCCCCPVSVDEFAAPYARCPGAMALSSVAVREDDGAVVGAIKMNSHHLRASNSFEAALHRIEPGEYYVEWFAVRRAARGAGAGSMLLERCAQVARARGGLKLTLAVIARNPAVRLYERHGFVRSERRLLDSWTFSLATAFVFGFHCWWPTGGPRSRVGFGGFMMEKALV